MEQINVIKRVLVFDCQENKYISFTLAGEPFYTILENAYQFKTMEAATSFINSMLETRPLLGIQLKAETYKISYSKLT